MQQVETHIAVLVTASAEGDDVRRGLGERGIVLAAATATLVTLRRSLVRAVDVTPIVLCVTLDEPTLQRHGRSLQGLLDDRISFITPLRAIGLMLGGRAADGWESLGCDAIATSLDQVPDLLDRFATDWPLPVGGRFAELHARIAGNARAGFDRNRSSSWPAETRATDLRRPRP